MAATASSSMSPVLAVLVVILGLFIITACPTSNAFIPSNSFIGSSISASNITNRRKIPRKLFSSSISKMQNRPQNPTQRPSYNRDPSFFEIQWRRITVFKTAFTVFFKYKWGQFHVHRIKKRHGIQMNDDDHPIIEEYWNQLHQQTATYLLEKIQQLEGFWIKVGQYISSRADIIPQEYLQTLSVLQDSMPTKNWNDTYHTIKQELCNNDKGLLEDIFEWIDPNPLSTASLAQVHKARLKSESSSSSSGQQAHDVVIKVQHRGVAKLMLQDMENLRVILKLLALTDPDLDFNPVIQEYNNEVQKELDFRLEAQNMNEIRELLEQSNIQVIIPKTIPELVTERVLVMDFCEGFPVRDTNKLDEYNVDREMLLERVCAAWAIQMHVGGVFNCDPHLGNILVSTSVPDDASVPVLLDFGLTKRLDPKIKVAFARLMHASHENDIDALLQSFDEMGLKMNRHDPFEDMANMQRGFGDTVPQSQAREVAKRKSKDYERRMEAKRAEAGLKKGQKLRSPVDAWPSELVFFGRVTAMLRGMCSRLDVSYPYLRTMALAASQTLREDVPVEDHAVHVIHPSAAEISSRVQTRLVEAIEDINHEGHMVGLQVCVMKEGKQVANIAAGILGTSNPRPVTPSTLFNIFSVSKGVLTIGLLRLVQDGRIQSLDDPVAKYWHAFDSKQNITIRQLLSHQSGLANAYPEDVSLDTLLDWSSMTAFIAKEAIPSHDPGVETQYHALSFAWLVGGLIEAVTGEPYENWLDQILPHTKQSFPGEEEVRRDLFMAGVPDSLDYEKDLAVLSVQRNDSVRPSKPPEEAAGNGSNDGGDEDNEETRKTKAKKVLDKYRGLQQLMNPSIFNMRKVREAKLPSANGHASAESLARVFDAVIRGNDQAQSNPILSKEMLDLARTPSQETGKISATDKKQGNQAMLDDAQASFGLGFQLHEFTLANGEKAMSIGHAGLGGSVVIAIPEEEAVVAFTLNQLSMDSVARKRILGIIFDEFGWIGPASIPVETTKTVMNTTTALV